MEGKDRKSRDWEKYSILNAYVALRNDEAF